MGLMQRHELTLGHVLRMEHPACLDMRVSLKKDGQPRCIGQKRAHVPQPLFAARDAAAGAAAGGEGRRTTARVQGHRADEEEQQQGEGGGDEEGEGEGMRADAARGVEVLRRPWPAGAAHHHRHRSSGSSSSRRACVRRQRGCMEGPAGLLALRWQQQQLRPVRLPLPGAHKAASGAPPGEPPAPAPGAPLVVTSAFSGAKRPPACRASVPRQRSSPALHLSGSACTWRHAPTGLQALLRPLLHVAPSRRLRPEQYGAVGSAACGRGGARRGAHRRAPPLPPRLASCTLPPPPSSNPRVRPRALLAAWVRLAPPPALWSQRRWAGRRRRSGHGLTRVHLLGMPYRS